MTGRRVFTNTVWTREGDLVRIYSLGEVNHTGRTIWYSATENRNGGARTVIVANLERWQELALEWLDQP